MDRKLPVFIPGRRGGISIVDAIIHVLLSMDGKSPLRTLSEIQDRVAQRVGYNPSASTIRSAIYSHRDLFDCTYVVGRPTFALSRKAKRLIGKG
jgi:hypothetical protein